MSNWITPFPYGGAVEAGSFDGTNAARGINITGSADTKGSWQQIIASTSYAYEALYFSTTNQAHGGLFDVGVGPASGEETIALNIMSAGPVASNKTSGIHVVLPIRIPAASRLAIRGQLYQGASAARVSLRGAAAGWHGAPAGGHVEGIGAATSDSGGVHLDPGASANTKGSWTEIIASTSEAIIAICPLLGFQENAAMANAHWRIDVGMGAASSEVVIIPDIVLATATAEAVTGTAHPWYPVSIPAGSRLAARAMCDITDATDRLTEIVLLALFA